MRRAAVASATRPAVEVPGVRDEVLRPAAVAEVWTGVGAPLETMAVPGVLLAPGDVIVAVELATLCSSDVHIAAGHRSAPAPMVLGHECVGRVMSIGAGGALDVSGAPIALGDRVVWSVAVSCGDCDRCTSALPQKCRHLRTYGHERIGAHWELSGGLATHVHVLAGTAIVPVGERIPARVAAPAACGAATAWAALRRAEREVPLPRSIVTVTGAGIVGLSATAIAADRGATVIVSEPDKKRRRLARLFGAAATIDPCDAGALETALRGLGVGGVEGVDIAVEASGAPSAVETALTAVGVGGVAVLVGSLSPAPPVSMDAEAIVRGLVTIAGVQHYTGDDLRDAVEYLRGAWGRHPFEDLVDPVLPLAAADEALALAAAGGAFRVGVDPRR